MFDEWLEHLLATLSSLWDKYCAGSGRNMTDTPNIVPDSWDILHVFACGNSDAQLVLVRGSVTDFRGACIVNAANEGCLGGGGVDGAIVDLGGENLAHERLQLPILGSKTIKNKRKRSSAGSSNHSDRHDSKHVETKEVEKPRAEEAEPSQPIQRKEEPPLQDAPTEMAASATPKTASTEAVDDRKQASNEPDEAAPSKNVDTDMDPISNKQKDEDRPSPQSPEHEPGETEERSDQTADPKATLSPTDTTTIKLDDASICTGSDVEDSDGSMSDNDKAPIRCHTGSAVLTGPGDYGPLTEYIIHAVGPNYYLVPDVETGHQLLWSAYQASLDMADQQQVPDIAFCLLSAGIFRASVPLSKILLIALQSIQEWTERHHQTTLKTIFVCGYTERECRLLMQAGQAVLGEQDSNSEE